MRYLIGFLTMATILAGGFAFLFKSNTSEISVNDLPAIPEARVLSVATSSFAIVKKSDEDIENQKSLVNLPSEIKAVYMTSWSSGSEKKTDYLIKLIKETELNAVVIDIKDFSGYITYDIKNSDVEKYGAKQIRTLKINSLIKKFHDENIYVIARITIFQDPILAKAHPEWAIHSKTKCQSSNINCQMLSSTLWLDHKGLAWMDPAAKEVWDYNVAIGKDALNRGFDELNFDYIRFASDGFIGDMGFPVWNEIIPKQEVIKNFFKYLREQFSDAKISVDLFGQATIDKNDLGIGQIIEDAYAYFDYICPMVYPSHYAKMFLGYKNPANYPYEVVKYSMDSALQKIGNWKLEIGNSLAINKSPKLRPWLQDFDLGADYDAEKVKKQIQGVYDSASSTPESINGWMLWSPSNVYTREALE
ncbi:hypothetical protein COS33_00995 [Candidatus Wolfebacteria bacterium CG02_land_8_20_14_3_00_37_12]|uniref:DUF4015 domain-containing protein n=2 Tax=Candidatus Wolfeibacteriota TaxID=1752735 RepID=A0A2M7Q856_9BACT|nr:MAG: hypothetical protein COS33_00995 [Candidatus Wolfebacteria bacterium CG02_land_8_20_14_3_00_37_12]PIY59292.1 MAG: hypothetical protein COY96_02625 [Candidatus Wolfebacteria bacterium CG_4_10_14_0_8_um_filter_37_11]